MFFFADVKQKLVQGGIGAMLCNFLKHPLLNPNKQPSIFGNLLSSHSPRTILESSVFFFQVLVVFSVLLN